MAARHEEGCYQRKVSLYFFLFAEGPSNDHVGLARSTVFREIRAGAIFKTGDFAKEKLEGAIVVRLLYYREALPFKMFLRHGTIQVGCENWGASGCEKREGI